MGVVILFDFFITDSFTKPSPEILQTLSRHSVFTTNICLRIANEWKCAYMQKKYNIINFYVFYKKNVFATQSGQLVPLIHGLFVYNSKWRTGESKYVCIKDILPFEFCLEPRNGLGQRSKDLVSLVHYVGRWHIFLIKYIRICFVHHKAL